MFAPFPDTAKLDVSGTLASALLASAEKLPLYDNEDFYSPALQAQVHDSIRNECQEEYDWLIGSVKERIARSPYCVLIEGLRFDEGNRLFVAINRAFGELVALPYQKPRSQLVHYIQPATDIPSPRGGHESERLHTDTTDWDDPVELISMICVRPDLDGGGRSQVLDLDTIRADIRDRLGLEVLRILESELLPWQLAPHCGGGVKWRTVLTEAGICWRRYTIDQALDSQRATLSKEILEILDSFECVLTTNTGTMDFLMLKDQLLISDNTRTIHARTPITNGHISDRLMIRSWVRTSKGNINGICAAL